MASAVKNLEGLVIGLITRLAAAAARRNTAEVKHGTNAHKSGLAGVSISDLNRAVDVRTLRRVRMSGYILVDPNNSADVFTVTI